MSPDFESFTIQTQARDYSVLDAFRGASRAELEVAAQTDNIDRKAATQVFADQGTLPSLDLFDTNTAEKPTDSRRDARLQIEPEQEVVRSRIHTDDAKSVRLQVEPEHALSIDLAGSVASMKQAFDDWYDKLATYVHSIESGSSGEDFSPWHDDNQIVSDGPLGHYDDNLIESDLPSWFHDDNLIESDNPPGWHFDSPIGKDDNQRKENYDELIKGSPNRQVDDPSMWRNIGPVDNLGECSELSVPENEQPTTQAPPSDNHDVLIERRPPVHRWHPFIEHEDRVSRSGQGEREISAPVYPPASEPESSRDFQFQKQKEIIDQLVGEKPDVLGPGVNPRLACALAISEVLSRVDPSIGRTSNVHQLQKELVISGYEPVSIDNIQPGDVIIGLRPDGMPGHAAISMGDGKVFNNNSNAGAMAIDSIEKFKQGMHDERGKWNPNGYSEVIVYRKH